MKYYNIDGISYTTLKGLCRDKGLKYWSVYRLYRLYGGEGLEIFGIRVHELKGEK